MTSTTKTKTETDSISASSAQLDSARDSLREAEAEHVETLQRLETFRSFIKAGDSLPKGQTLAKVEDELSMSSLRIEGLTEAVRTAEDDRATAVADDVARQVREVVSPLATGERAHEATSQIVSILKELLDEQVEANAVIRNGHRKLKSLPESRYGKARRVSGVGIDPNSPFTASIRIDGTGYGVVDPKVRLRDVLAKAEQMTLRHTATN